MSLLFSSIAFISSWAVAKYKIAELQTKVTKLETLREVDQKTIQDFKNENETKREVLKDSLIDRFHTLDKKVTEIHTIITKKGD